MDEKDYDKNYEQSERGIKIPKNIRQVGQPAVDIKIYVEDYVITYVKKYSQIMEKDNEIIILTGFHYKEDNIDYIFVNGAVSSNHSLEDDIDKELFFRNINADIEKYFKGDGIVGWGIIHVDDISDESIENVCDIFGCGDENVLFMYNEEEKEENCALICEKKIYKQKGYYIYYERNEHMQNYLLEFKQNKSIEYGYAEEVLPKIKKKIEDSVETERFIKNNKIKKYSYAIALVACIVVCGIGQMNIKKVGVVTKDRVKTVISDFINEKNDYELTPTDNNVSGNVEINKEINVNNVKKKNDTNNSKIITKEGGSNDKSNGILENEANKIKNNNTYKENEKGSQNKIIYYKVVKGDSLESISKKIYGDKSGIGKIKAANNLKNENFICEGEKIIIPQ